jgi:putative ABC transport system permease protein
MIRNYFTISLRNLLKRKSYTALNILGLTIGSVCCLLIFQYVSRERSFDTFEKNAPQILRIRLDQYKQGKLMWQSATSYPAIAPAMKAEFPEVESTCRLVADQTLLSNSERNIKFTETKGFYADPSAISMFGVDMVSGNSSDALSGPFKMVISESMAKKYFGTTDVTGKILTTKSTPFFIGNENTASQPFEITGVFKDYPSNSHLAINYLASYATIINMMRADGTKGDPANTAWGWYDFYTYIQLKPATSVANFQSKLQSFADRHINNRAWNKTNNVKNSLAAIPLTDIHLYSNANQEAGANGNGNAVNFMFMIALIIMGIAWVNYINLSTARSVERAKEVGVRKVLGAAKFHLIRQFMLENILLNITALTIAAILIWFCIGPFNHLMGDDSITRFAMTAQYWLLFAGIFIAGTLLSGLYPAFVLSGYQPVKVLKGAFKNTSGGLILRKGLITVQFSISVILIAGTIIVYQQVNYMQHQKLGANISQTLVLDGAQSVKDSLYQNTFQPFKTEALKIAGVKGVTASSDVMSHEIYWTNSFTNLEHKEMGSITLYRLGIDYDYIPQFELKLLEGRNFSPDFKSDKKAVVLNEKAAKALGFRDAADAVGKKLSDGDEFTVIGVVQDFHQQGLKKAIEPYVMSLSLNARSNYSIKLQTSDLQHTVAALNVLWGKYFPDDPFNYSFLDEQFNKQYHSDQQFGQMFMVFAFLAILIACLGLVGLSAYNILQRTKEVGIRKVLGASVQRVVFILSKDFLILVAISFVVASPVAWLVMHNWLQEYAYRVDISWWVFAITCILTFCIAMSTLSFQAIKAALANPVKSLRSE